MASRRPETLAAPALVAAFHALPEGAFTGTARGHRWRIVRRRIVGGRGWKIEGWKAGGGYISANFYALSGGTRVFPCEMPLAQVAAVITSLVPDPPPEGPPDGPGV